MTPHFKIGDRVVDKDGYLGTVRNLVEHKGRHWYEVALPGGEAVRYESDLSPANPGIGLTYHQTGGE